MGYIIYQLLQDFVQHIFETNPHGDVTAIGMWLVALISLGIIKHG